MFHASHVHESTHSSRKCRLATLARLHRSWPPVSTVSSRSSQLPFSSSPASRPWDGRGVFRSQVFLAILLNIRVPNIAPPAIGMGTLFYMIGAILKTHPPPPVNPSNTEGVAVPKASQAMAGLLYIYVCFYSMGWGPIPWVYGTSIRQHPGLICSSLRLVSDIFPTRTRHIGLSLASSTQWLFSKWSDKQPLDLHSPGLQTSSSRKLLHLRSLHWAGSCS